MLAKRIIPCLDVKDGLVVKGVQFRDHEIVGDIVTLAKRYVAEGADELVFYDITASSENRTVDYDWIAKIAAVLDIPFCVAGGIQSVEQAEKILAMGADKISVNSPALANPTLISALSQRFGQQCIVVGIDSFAAENDYYVYQYTGDVNRARSTHRRTLDWIKEVQDYGAGEIVLNCMNQDGVRAGYDILQLQKVRALVHIPLIASGGAGELSHFQQVFAEAEVNGALAASVFHSQKIAIPTLKTYLREHKISVR